MKFFAIPAIVALLAFSANQALSADIPPAPSAVNQPATAAQNAPSAQHANQGAAMTAPANAATAPALQANPQIPPIATTAPKPNIAVNAAGDPRPDQWRYKFEGNRWWYWTPENRWMVYGQTGWAYPDTAGGYITGYGGAPVAAPAPEAGVNVVVPGTTYYYGPAYGYYYPRRFYYGPGVYVGGPRWGVRVGRWWW